jgi:hypothetical protein
MRDHLRSMGKNLALAVGVFLVLDVALAQVGKRLVDTWELRAPERGYRIESPIYHHDLAPEASARATWGGIRYPYHTNSLGFRDAEVRRVPLSPAGRRIVLIGDSFTEGVGIPFEDTFAGIVARELGRRGIEVLNAAVLSYSPAIYYRKTEHLLEEEGLRFDALVVFLDVSDIQDEALRYRLDERDRVVDVEPEPPLSNRERVLRFVRLNSLTANVFSRARLALERTLLSDPRARLGADAEEASWTWDARAFDAWGRDGLARASANMDRLRALLERHGVALELVVYPWPDQILRGDLESRQVTFWRAWAEANHVSFLDLFPRFIGRGNPVETVRRYYIPSDFHWNAAGHRLVADALLDGGLAASVTGENGPALAHP